MASDQDIPGVVAPPPLLFAGTLAAGLLIDFCLLRVRSGLPASVRDGLAIACLAFAATLSIAAFAEMRRLRTNVEPWKPTTAVVTGSAFRYTRNPIYLSLALVYLAIASAADSVVALVLLAPLLIVVDRLVIAREERYLMTKFGATYLGYRRAVRRWI